MTDTEQDNNELDQVKDQVLKKNIIQKLFPSNKSRARIGSAFIYEIVGDQEVFDGVYPLLRGGKKDFGGDYTVIDYKGKIKYLSNPDPKDYTPTYNGKIRKILHVVKMAEDDFRIKKRLDETYYKEIKTPKIEEVPVEEDGEIVGMEEKLVLDDKGMQVFETTKVPYKRPSAIIQEGREAIKEGNEYEKKMELLRKQNESWFKKNAFAIMSYGVIIIMVFAFMFTANKLVDEFSEIRNDIYEDNAATRNYLSNGLISGIADKVAQKKVEDQNPPN